MLMELLSETVVSRGTSSVATNFMDKWTHLLLYDLHLVKEDSEKACGDVKLGRKSTSGYLLVTGLCSMVPASLPIFHLDSIISFANHTAE